MDSMRFPHKFRVLRAQFDETGIPATDDNGNPIYDAVPLKAVRMLDGEYVRDMDGNFSTYFTREMRFGYRTAQRSTSTYNDVIVSDYRIDCPLFLTEILANDILEIEDFERSYRGKVVKKTAYSLGTTIYFDEVKD